MVVPIDGTGTASVEPVMVPLVPGMQKPPCWVGKRSKSPWVSSLHIVPKKDRSWRLLPSQFGDHPRQVSLA
jgi:hypothetical protein